MIRVAVAEDDDHMRSALADFLGAEPEFELLWAADGPEEAIRKASTQCPDVMLMDVKMRDGGGIRATKEIRAMAPTVRVVALSAFGDRDTIMEMLRAGAVGYVLKGSPGQDIIQAIQSAAEGRSELSPAVSAEVVSELAGHLEREAAAEERRRRITDEVRRVLDEPDLLRIEYQPIVELPSMRVVGVEALSRFRSEPHHPPDEWFARAEEVGLHLELELEAIRRALWWIGELPHDVYLSLNVSPTVVASHALADLLAGGTRRALVIEITEHAAIDDYDAVARGLSAIRRRGGRLAVDDAGAGFASLRHILRLSPDIIKLDRSIINQIDTAIGHRAMARALIEFADATGATIVAEGIERKEELEAIRALGVRFAQGFYLGRPGELNALLERAPARR